MSAQVNDTILLDKYCNLAVDYGSNNRDSAIICSKIAIGLAEKLNQKFYKATALCDLGYNYILNVDYSNALANLLIAKKMAEDVNIGKNIVKTTYLEYYFTPGDPEKNRNHLLIYIKNNIAISYGGMGNHDKQLSELRENLTVVNSMNSLSQKYIVTNNIAVAFLGTDKLDSALYYELKANELEIKLGDKSNLGKSNYLLGEIYTGMKNYQLAKRNYLNALQEQFKSNNINDLAETQMSLGKLYRNMDMLDSSLYYVRESMINFKSMGMDDDELEEVFQTLSLVFKDKNNLDSAYFYLRLAKDVRDSLSLKELNTVTNFHNMNFEEQVRTTEMETEKIKTKNRNQILLLILGLVFFSVIAFILYRSNTNKKKANDLLAQQKQKIEKTLDELKATQNQLIQSEKMASLGELTAGIAHEIQNPLNFVNNFSELSNELMEEMVVELNNGDITEAIAISADISQNLEKINHHGKRADAIVKGMLQHSRSSSGQKEPTDINALCDEYLRLSYHGLRAKDKSFNATLKTDFDERIVSINIVPQDIGRVVLNLLTNAFYAVNERKDALHASQDVHNYEPTVSIITKKLDDKIEISVSDNGNGMTQSALDKIFQPFFTTKPTGQGTGLGLSLSYDIITKGHAGTLEVESEEGAGSVFTIRI